jgi:hypothetical protein
MKIKMKTAVCTLLLSTIAGAAFAQDADKKFGVEYGISTLGLYVAPTLALNANSNLRAPLFLGQFSDTFTDNGVTTVGKFSANSMALMGDFQPWANGIRVSGGFAFGGYEISGTSANPEFEGTTYVGSAKILLAQKNTVNPMFSIGYAKQFNNGISILADIGAKVGTYEMSVDTTGLTIPDQAQFDADLASVNKDLADVGLVPFITLGGVFRF